jgi:hypothetical protein
MKTALLIFTTLFCAQSACAQVLYGIKGGLNLSDIVINNVVNPDVEAGYDMKLGVHGGAFAELDLENGFLLLGELLYSVKGVNALGTNVNLHYATIPLLVEYKIADPFVLEGGIELGYLISATSRYGNLNSVWDNKTDIGLDAGLKYRSEKISIGLRFNAGMSSVIGKSGNTPSGEQIRYQNRVVSVSVGYVLGKFQR